MCEQWQEQAVDEVVECYRMQDELLQVSAWKWRFEDKLRVKQAEQRAEAAMQRLAAVVGPDGARDMISRRMRGQS
jgi:hypothetical protein